MALQNFVDGLLPTIKAAFLNQIDAFVNTLFNGATTVAQARTALGLSKTLLNVQVFSVAGTSTYNSTSGTNSILVRGQGAGGAGGGSPSSAASQVAGGSGGGAGGIGETFLTSGFTGGLTVVVGAGGTAVNGAAGNAGGVSNFGSGLLILNGGGGGGAAGSGAVTGSGPGTSGTASGGNILNSPGEIGFTFFASFAQGYVLSGAGASSLYGSGGNSSGANVSSGAGASAGVNATGNGAGGSGATAGNGGGQNAGGNGAPGIFIVYEFA